MLWDPPAARAPLRRGGRGRGWAEAGRRTAHNLLPALLQSASIPVRLLAQVAERGGRGGEGHRPLCPRALSPETLECFPRSRPVSARVSVFEIVLRRGSTYGLPRGSCESLNCQMRKWMITSRSTRRAPRRPQRAAARRRAAVPADARTYLNLPPGAPRGGLGFSATT